MVFLDYGIYSSIDPLNEFDMAYEGGGYEVLMEGVLEPQRSHGWRSGATNRDDESQEGSNRRPDSGT